MYVNATSIRLSRGKSTPAIRANPDLLISLALLMFGVIANDPDDAFAFHDPAFFAAYFNRRPNFHKKLLKISYL
jgi:hypothetical protein